MTACNYFARVTRVLEWTLEVSAIQLLQLFKRSRNFYSVFHAQSKYSFFSRKQIFYSVITLTNYSSLGLEEPFECPFTHLLKLQQNDPLKIWIQSLQIPKETTQYYSDLDDAARTHAARTTRDYEKSTFSGSRKVKTQSNPFLRYIFLFYM